MNNEKVYLSLGSNQGDSLELLLQALELLQKKGISINALSGVYQTAAVGYTEQADFLNMVVCGETAFSPEKTLKICQEIESMLGRERTIHWGPRTIDLDIIFFGEQHINTKELQIPHPRFNARAFVLIPLREIAPQLLEKLQLQEIIPRQRIKLLITSADVKIMLKNKGLVIAKG
jgi:2-amino-4-hydroxy-6-hydroxymethyldihydropteridine diphosphokinase